MCNTVHKVMVVYYVYTWFDKLGLLSILQMLPNFISLFTCCWQTIQSRGTAEVVISLDLLWHTWMAKKQTCISLKWLPHTFVYQHPTVYAVQFTGGSPSFGKINMFFLIFLQKYSIFSSQFNKLNKRLSQQYMLWK